MLTQEQVKKVIDYDPQSGIFTWKRRKRRGKVAGTVHDKRGYLKVMIKGESVLLHRLAFLWMTGSWPEGGVAHKDGNPSNNAWDNLRDTAKSEDPKTQKPAERPALPKGVYAKGRKWQALISDPKTGKVLYLGTFVTPGGAYAAYCEAAMKLHKGRFKAA